MLHYFLWGFGIISALVLIMVGLFIRQISKNGWNQ